MKKTSTHSKPALWASLAASAGIALGLSSCDQAAQAQESSEPEKKPSAPKVLYVTHEPGKYHDYTGQRKIFTEIAKKNGWNAVIVSGNQKDLIKKLSTDDDFAKHADLIIYNFCLAHCGDPMVPYNIMQQTEKYGKPALLIHCSLHSFWPTYKERGGNAIHAPGAHAKAHTRKDLLAQWQKDHPNKPFPAWPNYTGIASTSHPPRDVTKVTPIGKDHPILKGVKEYNTVKDAELYNNFITAEDEKDVKTLIKGKNRHGEAIVLWENTFAGKPVISFTLGHSNGEWNQEEFRQIFVNAVDYLYANK